MDKDKQWNEIFKKFDILNKINKKGSFTISKKKIGKYIDFDSLAEIDYFLKLPKIMKDKQISLIQTSNDEYLLGKFISFQKLPEWNTNDINKTSLPTWLKTINISDIKSPYSIIYSALASYIFNDFFNDDELILTSTDNITVDGFGLRLAKKKTKVNNCLIDIDALLESKDRIVVVKVFDRLINEFEIKDLYYPFKMFSQTIDKPIHTVIIIYSNGIYRLLEYKFVDEDIFSSIMLIKDKRYALDTLGITNNDLEYLLSNTKIDDSNYGIVWPESSDIDMMISLMEQLDQKDMNKAELSKLFKVEEKQITAYYNSLKYFGLANIKKGNCCLSEKGKELINSYFKERYLKLMEAIAEKPVFNFILKKYLSTNQIPNKYDIKQALVDFDVIKETSKLDYKTMVAKWWIDWIINNSNAL